MREVAIPIAAWNGLFSLSSVFSNIFDGYVPEAEPRNTGVPLFRRVSEVAG